MANMVEGPESLIGTKLGRCRLQKIIGSGGMGTVYLAHYGPTDQDVAVKVLAPQLSSDPEYVARFIREGKEAGKIDHANVVRVIEADRQDNTYYIVMEYVRGQPLDELLRDEKRLSFQKATRIIRDVTKGLEAAQGKGVIHRDIKPANILLDTKGNPKLSDFGLAKQAGSRKGLTVEGLFMGTPEYVSPEQAEGKKVDFRTDIYALGVTYYQLLSGKFPFLGQTDVEMAMKRLKEDPRPIQDAFPGVDARAIPIVERMLKREPDDRYQDAAALLKSLDPLVRNERRAPLVPKTATVIAKLPFETQRRLRVRFSAGLLVPAMALAALAGAMAPGGATYGEAFSNLVRSPWAMGAMAAALVALGVGLFAIRKELQTSCRAPAIIAMTVAAVLAMVLAGGTLERPVVEPPIGTLLETLHAVATSAIVAPVNLFLLAVAVAVMACMACFELDEASPRPIAAFTLLGLASVLWYAFAAAAEGPLAPFDGIKAAPGVSFTLLGLGLAATVTGMLMIGARAAEVRTRMIGSGVLAAGWIALLIFGAAGAAGAMGDVGAWARAVGEALMAVPRGFARSGGLAIVACGLLVWAVFVMRAGIARTQAFYKPRKA